MMDGIIASFRDIVVACLGILALTTYLVLFCKTKGLVPGLTGLAVAATALSQAAASGESHAGLLAFGLVMVILGGGYFVLWLCSPSQDECRHRIP